MEILSDDILFFFGAGTSAAFGIPTMSYITDAFRSEINSNGSSDERKVYDEILNLLQRDLGSDGADIEAVFSVIDGLKEYKIENIGELSLYASWKVCNRTLLDDSMLHNNHQTLISLEASF
jgi:hypothetical protein